MGADIKRVWFLGGGQQDLSFDTTISEEMTSRLTVTRQPVETGVKIADHAYMEPLELEIEGQVGDIWLHGRDRQGNPVNGDVFQSVVSRSATAWAVLRGLQASAEPFDVQTGLGLMQNMVLEEISPIVNKRNANALRFRARLVETTFVSTQTVTYPPRAAGKPHRQASAPVAAGEKKTDPVTDQQRAQTIFRSLLPDSIVQALSTPPAGQ